jgi:UDP-N-acetyl-D-mannosaminuronate dehydrogenase
MTSPPSVIRKFSPDTMKLPLETSGKPTMIAVIGVGYVGEHLVRVFSSAFRIVAYDISASRTKLLRLKYLHLENVKFSNDERDLKDASHFLICVPTALGFNGKVDSSHVRSAIEMLHCYVSDKSIVVIESTVAVGMTREFLGPLAKSHGIFAGMSPEVSKRSKQNGRGRANITTEDRSRSS